VLVVHEIVKEFIY